MVFYVLKKALAMLMQKPVKLWGLSLLYALMCGLATTFGVLPIVSIPIMLVLQFGMTMVYLAAINGEEYNSDQLFMGFSNFWRVFGGMGWQQLWIYIWSAVPVVNMIKGYSYSFVPYILVTDKDVSGTQALRVSMEKTRGYKMTMFLSDVLVFCSFTVVCVILGLLGSIPYIGGVFIFLLVVFVLLFLLLVGLWRGLIHACIWEEAENPQYVAPVKPAAPGYPQYPQQPGYPQYPQQPEHPQYPQQGYPQYPQYPQQPYTYAPQQATPQYPYPQAPVNEAPEVPNPFAPTAAPEVPSTPVEPAAPEAAPASAAFCPNCGSPLIEGAVFCGNCGHSLN